VTQDKVYDFQRTDTSDYYIRYRAWYIVWKKYCGHINGGIMTLNLRTSTMKNRQNLTCMHIPVPAH